MLGTESYLYSEPTHIKRRGWKCTTLPFCSEGNISFYNVSEIGKIHEEKFLFLCLKEGQEHVKKKVSFTLLAEMEVRGRCPLADRGSFWEVSLHG